MYLPTLTRTAPSGRSGRNTREPPERLCPTVRAYYWHVFDLEYHGAMTDETSKMPKEEGVE